MVGIATIVVFCDNCGWSCDNCGWLRQLWTLRHLWSHQCLPVQTYHKVSNLNDTDKTQLYKMHFFVLGFWMLAFCHWRFVPRSYYEHKIIKQRLWSEPVLWLDKTVLQVLVRVCSEYWYTPSYITTQFARVVQNLPIQTHKSLQTSILNLVCAASPASRVTLAHSVIHKSHQFRVAYSNDHALNQVSNQSGKENWPVTQY